MIDHVPSRSDRSSRAPDLDADTDAALVRRNPSVRSNGCTDTLPVLRSQVPAQALSRAESSRSRRHRENRFSLTSAAATDGREASYDIVVSPTTSGAAGVQQVTVTVTGDDVDPGVIAEQVRAWMTFTVLDGPASVNDDALVDAAGDMSPASWEQTRRLAARRASMIRGGAVSYRDLAEQRGQLPSSVRTWATRLRTRGELITVRFGRDGWVPVFQLDESLDVRADLRGVLRELRSLGDWERWTWLESPTSLLSGEVPHEVVRDDEGRVLEAARRFVKRSERPSGE